MVRNVYLSFFSPPRGPCLPLSVSRKVMVKFFAHCIFRFVGLLKDLKSYLHEGYYLCCERSESVEILKTIHYHGGSIWGGGGGWINSVLRSILPLISPPPPTKKTHNTLRSSKKISSDTPIKLIFNYDVVVMWKPKPNQTNSSHWNAWSLQLFNFDSNILRSNSLPFPMIQTRTLQKKKLNNIRSNFIVILEIPNN